MKEITMEKMQELMNNPEFAAKLRSAKTAEEMVRVFAEYDVQVTEEELKESCKKTLEILNEKGYMDGDELSEEALDLVSGGIKWGGYASGLGLMAIGISVGAACPPAGLLLLGIGGVIAIYHCF